MRILWLGWRDPKHPLAGGSAVLAMEITKRWAAAGHEVVLLTAGFPGAKSQETLDRVRVVRVGGRYGFWFLQLCAPWFYGKLPRGRFDLVIDEIHALPFLAPLYVKEPVALMVCEVGRENWRRTYPRPLALVGARLEQLLLRCYRDLPVIAISPSTKRDLVDRGLRPQHVEVVYCGINSRPSGELQAKAPDPVLVYVGRINADKRVHHLIDALAEVRRRVPNTRLWIVGKGEPAYSAFLEEEARRLGLESAVTFFGYVSEERKVELMAQAWLVVSASVTEGWGLIVIEGNAVGTPAVVHNVPGYRDSVRDGETGLLTKAHTPHALAESVVRVLQDGALYKRLRERAIEWSAQFDWQNTADGVLAAAVGPPSRHDCSH
ncbi:MAG TPA: glycosyltransferase family 4 protein [Chloroflexota bacterium]|nr:glycosyltransferase family 4 protein [Chloroflexota bacterium]